MTTHACGWLTGARAWLAVCAAAALSVAACDETGAPAEVEIRSVATVHDMMVGLVEPAAAVVWESVGTIVSREGRTNWAPETDAEWERVHLGAMMVAESGNLLLVEGRGDGRDGWAMLARALVDAGLEAIVSVESRDPEAVFDVGGVIYDACANCHDRYLVGGF